MLLNKTLQKHLSVLLVSVYAFVVLFSAKFHQHSHSFIDFGNHAETAKSFKASLGNSNTNDCVVCHFLNSKIGSVPQVFEFKPLEFNEVQIQNIAYVSKNFSSEEILFRLRGPPVFI